MVSFKVGDRVNICTTVWDFCGASSNLYFINDINISIEPCSINIKPPSCLDLSNILIEFQWVNSKGSVETRNCSDSVKLKILGSSSTNSQGVAAISYIISQEDLNLFNSNPIFDLRACIKNKTSGEVDGFGKVRGNFRIDGIQIIQNLCLNVTCEDKCIENDLYTQVCDPNTGNCVQGSLKESNSLICLATHYIEYDVGFLPQSFLDLVGPNIVAISNEIGRYIGPIVASNIIYKEAIYSSSDKKFRIYIEYTPSMSLTTNFPEYRYYYNELTGKIESLALINTLPALAGFIAGIILFLKLNVILKVVGPWGIAIAAVIAVVGAVMLAYTIKDIITGIITPYTVPEPTPAQKVKIIKEFVDVYVDPAADDLTPQCKCPTPTLTCNVSDMLFYVGGRATARYAQCMHAHVNKGDVTTICDETIRTEIESIKNDLANGTITVQQACTRLENNIVIAVKEEVTKVIEAIDCDPGWTWNKDTQKCEKSCNFPVMGYCLDTPLTIGALLLGGYVVYKIAKG